MNRLKSLYRQGLDKMGDESVKDTLQDLANYAIMTLAEMEWLSKNTSNASRR